MLQAIASRTGTGARGLGVAAFTLTGADGGALGARGCRARLRPRKAMVEIARPTMRWGAHHRVDPRSHRSAVTGARRLLAAVRRPLFRDAI
jgi:hypothetical protein